MRHMDSEGVEGDPCRKASCRGYYEGYDEETGQVVFLEQQLGIGEAL